MSCTLDDIRVVKPMVLQVSHPGSILKNYRGSTNLRVRGSHARVFSRNNVNTKKNHIFASMAKRVEYLVALINEFGRK